jgi:coproporphyrinogen III oxidase-like Fe-S oxidoreductase
LGLRTVEGLLRAPYRRRFGADPLDHYGPALRSLEQGGWLTVHPARIAPTRRGLWLADELALRLM